MNHLWTLICCVGGPSLVLLNLVEVDLSAIKIRLLLHITSQERFTMDVGRNDLNMSISSCIKMPTIVSYKNTPEANQKQVLNDEYKLHRKSFFYLTRTSDLWPPAILAWLVFNRKKM